MHPYFCADLFLTDMWECSKSNGDDQGGLKYIKHWLWFSTEFASAQRKGTEQGQLPAGSYREDSEILPRAVEQNDKKQLSQW